MRVIACVLMLLASRSDARAEDPDPRKSSLDESPRGSLSSHWPRETTSHMAPSRDTAGLAGSAGPRVSPFTDVHVLVMRYLDTGRVGVSVGASTGWRETADVQLRVYATHRWSVGARYRLALESEGHASELYAGYAIGYGKLLVARELLMQVRLMLEGTGGLARTESNDGFTGSLGVGLRLSPSTVEWLELELVVRESWLPDDAAFAARVVTPPDRRTRALEAGFAVTVLIGKRRRTCQFR
jgi:hypothetical protein